MAFTVQGDSPVEDANAYVSDVWVAEYHQDRGRTDVNAGFALQQAIIRASDYLDQRFNFIGRPFSINQSLAWPREDAVTRQCFVVAGVPLAVKKAVAEYAAIALAQDDLNPTPERDTSGRSVIAKSEEVGPLSESVRYAKSGAMSMPSYPKADAYLSRAGLIAGANRILRG